MREKSKKKSGRLFEKLKFEKDDTKDSTTADSTISSSLTEGKTLSPCKSYSNLKEKNHEKKSPIAKAIDKLLSSESSQSTLPLVLDQSRQRSRVRSSLMFGSLKKDPCISSSSATKDDFGHLSAPIPMSSPTRAGRDVKRKDQDNSNVRKHKGFTEVSTQTELNHQNLCFDPPNASLILCDALKHLFCLMLLTSNVLYQIIIDTFIEHNMD